MILNDYHTHNYLCKHANGTLEEYILAGISKNLNQIGLSDHFPMHLISKKAKVETFAMTMDEFPKYIEECKNLKAIYKDKIEVKVASEVDFTPHSFLDYKKAINPYLEDFDYIIGSVHVVDFEKYGPTCIDGPESPELIEKFGLDIFYKEYYKANLEMVKTGFYDIVGHCDLPKKFGVLPDESSWESTLNFLDEVEKSNMVVEINNSGLYKKVGIQYPSDRIISELIHRKIPLTFGSDAHSPDLVGYDFENTIKKLRKIEEIEKITIKICQFEKRERILIPLEKII